MSQSILPVLLKYDYELNQWEFGFYKTSATLEPFDVSKITNWQNNHIFSGIADGYYYICSRHKTNQKIFDFERVQVNCGNCTLAIRAVVRYYNTYFALTISGNQATATIINAKDGKAYMIGVSTDNNPNNATWANGLTIQTIIGTQFFHVKEDNVPLPYSIAKILEDGNGGGTVGQENLVLIPDQSVGDVVYNSAGGVSETRSKLSINETTNQFIVNDLQWNSHFEDSSQNTKVVFWGTETETGVRTKQLVNNDLEDMRGFSLAAWVGYMKNNPIWEGRKFLNHSIHIPTRAGQNRRRWQEGDVEYFFMPEEYEFTNSKIPNYLTLNNFQLPSGVYFLNQFGIGNQNNLLALSKGATHIKQPGGPNSKRVQYDYDAWAYNAVATWNKVTRDANGNIISQETVTSGCPQAYSTTEENIQNWLSAVDATTLKNSFISAFMNVHKDNGMTVMDYEAIAHANPYAGDYVDEGTTKNKLGECFKVWKQNATSKLGIWGRAFLNLSRAEIEGTNYKASLTTDLKFNGTFQDWTNQRQNVSKLSLTPQIYLDNMDFFYIGGYMNFPTNFSLLEHGLIQLEMMKKFFPEKINLFSWWHNVEYVGNKFESGQLFFKKNDGTPLRQNIKPIVFPHDHWNVGIWFLTEKNSGVDLWSEPYYRINNPDFYGNGDDTFGMNGNALANSYTSNNGQTQVHCLQDLSGMDWLWGAAKRVAQNGDFIEANTSWQYLEYSKDNGQTWITGDALLPSQTMYDKNPIAKYKLNAAGNKALVKICNAHGDATKMAVFKVRIGNKQADIKCFGRYTSFVIIHNL